MFQEILHWLWPANPMKARRNLFLFGRKGVSDKDFLLQIGVDRSPEFAVAIALRRAMARTCNITPEMLHPEDQPRTLCSIMDWRMPNWGWLLCVDYGKFSDGVEFGLFFEDEYGALIGEPARRWQPVDWFERLPSFAGFYMHGRWSGTEPATFGEWVKQAVEIILKTE